MEAVGNARFEKPEDAVEREELKKMIVEALDTVHWAMWTGNIHRLPKEKKSVSLR